MGTEKLVSALKPRDPDVLALAEREADPGSAARFEPICHGPWFAVAALAVVGLLSLPGMMWRLVKAFTRSAGRGE